MTTKPTTSTKPVYRKQRNYRKWGEMSLYYLLAILAALIFVYPLLWMLSASLKPSWEIYRAPLKLIPSEFDFSVYTEIFKSTPFPTYLWNSVLYSVSSSLITLAFAVLAAYGLSRHQFKGKNMFMLLIMIVQLVPGLVSVIPLYIMMNSVGLYNNQLGIILLYSASGISWGVWVMKGFFDTIPIAIDESAMIDGASKFRIIWRILLPLLVPGLASSFIIIFMGRWNEFALANALLRDPDFMPLTVGTYRLLGPDESDFRLTAGASLVNIVPILIIFMVLQRYLVSGLAAGAVKQ